MTLRLLDVRSGVQHTGDSYKITLWRAIVLPAGSRPEDAFISRPDRYSHWTWDEDWAEWFANELAESNWSPQGGYAPDYNDLVRVVVEAEIDTRDIIHDESIIEKLRGGFDLPEPEVVLRPGATVNVKAIRTEDEYGRFKSRPLSRSWIT